MSRLLLISYCLACALSMAMPSLAEDCEGRLREAMSWQDLLMAQVVADSCAELPEDLRAEYVDWRGDWRFLVRVGEEPDAPTRSLQAGLIAALRERGFQAEGEGSCPWDPRLSETTLLLELDTELTQRPHPAQRSLRILELLPRLHAFRCQGYDEQSAQGREYFQLVFDPLKIAGKDDGTLVDDLSARIHGEKGQAIVRDALKRVGL